jgi:type I restriction enzyme S subunit
VLLAGNNANGIFPLKYFKGKFDAYQRTYVVRPRDVDLLTTRFLYYALRLKLDEFRSFSTGAATKFLTLKILNETEIQAPPPPIQQRIAGILSAYDELIENSQRRIKILEAMARTLYREWFVHFRFPGHESVPRVPSPLGEIPQGWEVKKVADFADFTRGFEPGSNAYEKEPGSDRVRFLRVGDLSKRDSGLYIAERLAEGRVLRLLDIALTLDGSVGEVRLGLVGAYSSGIRRIDVKDKSRLGWVFAYQLLLSDSSQATIQAHAKGTTIKHAGSAVGALSFVSPPRQLIERFESHAAPMIHRVLGLQQQVENLRCTRDLLLPRIFSGQIDVEALAS